MEYGLIATGCSGKFSIDLDQTLSEPTKWSLTFDMPKVYLSFSIASPEAVAEIHRFLVENKDANKHREIEIGKFGQSTVVLIKDDEFAGRFFLLIQNSGGTMRFTLTEEDIEHIIEALAQIKAETALQNPDS